MLASTHFGCAAASHAAPSTQRAPLTSVAEESPRAVVAPPPTPADTAASTVDVVLPERELVGLRSKPLRIHAPARPRTEYAIAIDYAAIAIASTTTPDPHEKGASFSITRIDRTPAVCPAGFNPRHKITWLMPKLSSAPTVMRLDGAVVPPIPWLDGTYEDPVFEGVAQRPAHAQWTSLERTGDVATVTQFAGTFRPENKETTAVRKSTVEADALLPGVLYAFRKCDSNCDEPLGSPLRDEELVVLGPPAIWVGSSDAPESRPVAYDQPFSIVTASLEPGASASLTLVALKQDIDDFRAHRQRVDPAPESSANDWLSFTVDVVWPSPNAREASAPEVNLFSGSGRASAAQLTPYGVRTSRSTNRPGCVRPMVELDPFF